MIPHFSCKIDLIDYNLLREGIFMEQKIILSADSTCDLGRELKKRYNVNFYPFHIILGEMEYMDNVDIFTDDIYRTYREKKILPKTAAINVAEYINYFKQWVEDGYEVIHLNLGGAISSAHQNCMIAAKELGNVYPIDSFNLSTGISLLVIEAANMINEGKSAREISENLKEIRNKVHSSFILDTLEFMHAGGRCSTIAAIGSNLLQLKPCIEVNNRSGAMTVGTKYRGNLEKVLTNYTKDKLKEYNSIHYDRVFITHSGIDDKYIQLVKNILNELTSFKEIFVTKASCTISSHCGPNTLGILFMTN